MGQYLAVGIVTEVFVSAAHAPACMTEDDLRVRVAKYLPALDIYDLSPPTEGEGFAGFRLRPSVWQGGLVALLEDLYPRLDPRPSAMSEHEEVFEALRVSEPDRWLDLARDRDENFLRFGAERPFPTFDSGGGFRSRQVRVGFEIVRLFVEGKVLAEEYQTSFGFFQHCMHVAFAKHELAKALMVYFSG